ncbi:hypothetical protein C479_14118 [Halovivax asiaticus JCM 14624]|uniref:HTR-like protein n=1 Tax=Halovivax asiaticus JCM 14624 TaxID=1227490 RepID=M0BC44_9EURY|nr:DUF106 domain-containing protein [Halovivax asiaticus]ELZ08481.1 hypothetical protein C479_14118 [Halovivax asiaticus JCM 14624]
MTRTVEKVNSLLREDAEMESALESIREHADENGGEVAWGDVSDDLTSGQWGRIIEQGVLVDGNGGFEIADREAFDEALDGDGDDQPLGGVEIDPEASKWSQWDKLAGLTALLLMIGYMSGTVRNAVGNTMNVFLGPLDANLPFYAVILSISLLTGLASALVQSNVMDPERMGKYQKRMQAVSERTKEAQKALKEAKERDANEAEIERLQNEVDRVQKEQMESMGENLGMFKEQGRMMVWSMLFIIPLFLWMYWKLRASGSQAVGGMEAQMILPMIGETSLRDGALGPMPAWIVWYFLCSMGFSQVIRKALDINMSPTTD